MGNRVTKILITTHFERDEPPAIPPIAPPPNDMRPRPVDRGRVKAARKVAARNRRRKR